MSIAINGLVVPKIPPPKSCSLGVVHLPVSLHIRDECYGLRNYDTRKRVLLSKRRRRITRRIRKAVKRRKSSRRINKKP